MVRTSMPAFALVLLFVSLPAVVSFSGGALVSPAARMQLAVSPRAQRSSCFLAINMELKDRMEGQDDSQFSMSALNARIAKIKERESNPVLNLQDRVTDSLEPLQYEAKKLQNKMPDPRGAIPTTGVPKWALPLGLIVGLSIFSAIISNTGGSVSDTYGAGLATGSL